MGGANIETPKGRISYDFGAMNYDKVVTVDLEGSKEAITRLGFKDNPKRFTDTYTNLQGRVASGDYTEEFNRLRSYVMGK